MLKISILILLSMSYQEIDSKSELDLTFGKYNQPQVEFFQSDNSETPSTTADRGPQIDPEIEAFIADTEAQLNANNRMDDARLQFCRSSALDEENWNLEIERQKVNGVPLGNTRQVILLCMFYIHGKMDELIRQRDEHR